VQAANDSIGGHAHTRPCTVKTNLLDFTPDTFKLAAGYTGAPRQVGSAEVIDLDDDNGGLPQGTLALIGYRKDGKPVTLFLKLAEARPGATVEYNRKSQSKLACTFKKLDANDGTGSNGWIAFGQFPA